MIQGIIKKLTSGKGLRLSVTAVILGLMMLTPMVAAAANQIPGVLPPNPVGFNTRSGALSGGSGYF